jgi:hypothetical protein
MSGGQRRSTDRAARLLAPVQPTAEAVARSAESAP